MGWLVDIYARAENAERTVEKRSGKNILNRGRGGIDANSPKTVTRSVELVSKPR